ncbi:DNA cytosine methyltransferase [Pseudomonas sp. BGr12]|uniref:DNA cytosine methyltransferase n=1 Tax=Pseudomonas sp. BGr12 TaxID=2936269 RepID=UPI00255A2339|nr:DNA (cytosine-5-)-methyltransferase [Pseudomonas sp. BJa5]MDL2430908.1 DNA (cytosine-5-)-methyltransferase [Pseudomonas sp. BJa5]
MKLFEDVSSAHCPAREIQSLQFDSLASGGTFTRPMRTQTVATDSVISKKLVVAGLFAGVGGLEEGFRQAGHESTMLCEFDPLARYVLRKHFPDAEITTDVTALKGLPDCDVLTAGFPCQDLSQVGRRRGISGPNSGLVESVFYLLRRQKKPPRWVVLENVPFMLSLDRGHAIRSVTGALEKMGYSWAYRTIDARAFGLPQRRRRVIIIASKTHDPRPVLLGVDATPPPPLPRGSHACGFYWTEGNTGLGWAVDSVPPLKGGSTLHIPSPPAIWFPRRRLIATPAIEDAERLQGFASGWTDISEEDPRGARKRWKMVGNAVSVPMARWIAERLTLPTTEFETGDIEDLPVEGSWPSSAWGVGGKRSRSRVSEWPVAVPNEHLSAFLKHKVMPLSNKATSGFLSRLVKSTLRYEEAFRLDLAHHAENVERD